MTQVSQRTATDPRRQVFVSPSILELSLDAMVKDEIVRLTMASDGVSEQDVLALRRIVPLVVRDRA